MSHRVLGDVFKAFDPRVGAGIGRDPGSGGVITPTEWGQMFSIVTTTAESMTLARPDRAGIMATVVLDTDGGDLTLTVTGGYNSASDTSIVFGDAGDMVTFLSVKTGSTYQWTVLSSMGTNLNTLATQAITAAAAVIVDGTINRVTLSGGAYAITLAAPSVAMRGKTLMIEYIGGDTDAVTLDLTNVQGQSSGTTATFNADNETLTLIGGLTKWSVIGETGVQFT